jgi:hypothetical protein
MVVKYESRRRFHIALHHLQHIQHAAMPKIAAPRVGGYGPRLRALKQCGGSHKLR